MTRDARGNALGAVLSQIQDGMERPVAFASRVSSEAEKKYAVGEHEALAFLWARERWHIYSYGRKFILRTDHQALTTLCQRMALVIDRCGYIGGQIGCIDMTLLLNIDQEDTIGW